MITAENIKLVRGEMRRLADAFEEHEERLREDERYRKYHGITGSPETGAIRRASHDLSRALVRLRKT